MIKIKKNNYILKINKTMKKNKHKIMLNSYKIMYNRVTKKTMYRMNKKKLQGIRTTIFKKEVREDLEKILIIICKISEREFLDWCYKQFHPC